MQYDFSKTFTHPISHIPYKIRVSIPKIEIPPEGFPVLYVLDGNAYGTMFQEIIKLQWRRSEKTKVSPMIMASIGYDTEEAFLPLRVYDFTPPTSTVSLPSRPDGNPWPKHGGAKEFLSFLENGVLPLISEKVRVHPDNHTLFGHSLGGLFVLYALFEKTQLFKNYISFSPSIWWNECQILEYVREEVLLENQKLFIAAENVSKMNMYEHAFALSKRLKEEYPEQVDFISPSGENHMSIVPTTISEALRFLYENG